MSDDWGDIESLPAQKSQAPKLLFCGCGCLLPVLLLLAVLGWGWRAAERGQDSELQWSELTELLPADGVPPGYALQFGMQIGWFIDVEVYVFVPLVEVVEGAEPTEPTELWMLIQQSEDVADMFDTSRKGVEPYTLPDGGDPVETIRVQGRDLPIALVRGQGPPLPWLDSDEDDQSLVVDITPEGGEGHLLLFVATDASKDLPPAKIEQFLAPFHVGPER